VDWLEIIMAEAAEGLGFAKLGKSARVFRILRMIRLLRLAKMTEIIGLLTERFHSDKLVIFLDVVKLVTIMVGAAHFVGCCWYAIGNAASDDNNWVVQHEYHNSDLGMKYVMSLRWAISQFAGGMDEVTPHSMGENIYAIFVYLIAFWSGAVFLSILTSSMTQWYMVGSQQKQQLTVLRRYLAQNNISKKLTLRLSRNAIHSLAEKQKNVPEEMVVLVQEVSVPLRVELHSEMYQPVLNWHPFFALYELECPHVLRRVCHSAMAICNLVKMDTIFDEGETPTQPKMYLVSTGLLAYNTISGKSAQVHESQWVCEHPLWVPWTHHGTLTAASDSRLYTLDCTEFQSIVGAFEHNGFDPRQYAIAFVNGLNIMDELTDLHVENPASASIQQLSAAEGVVPTSLSSLSTLNVLPEVREE
jgi:hypothetical protein